jgi:hypothetical protein
MSNCRQTVCRDVYRISRCLEELTGIGDLQYPKYVFFYTNFKELVYYIRNFLREKRKTCSLTVTKKTAESK